jgi:hypothetical protein
VLTSSPGKTKRRFTVESGLTKFSVASTAATAVPVPVKTLMAIS